MGHAGRKKIKSKILLKNEKDTHFLMGESSCFGVANHLGAKKLELLIMLQFGWYMDRPVTAARPVESACTYEMHIQSIYRSNPAQNDRYEHFCCPSVLRKIVTFLFSP